MDTLTLRLHELGPDLIRDLKQRYETALIEITVKDQVYAGAMNEPCFWSIIALFDWTKTGDDDAVIEPAVQALAKMAPEDIIRFYDILSEKLWQLDTEAHAQPFIDKHHKGYLSVDDFLYIRCCVVANGEEAFKQVLHHPENIPDLTFSRLLHVASKAFERRTGKIMNHIPAYNYETYSNENGWI
jgi:hypothetical protein